MSSSNLNNVSSLKDSLNDMAKNISKQDRFGVDEKFYDYFKYCKPPSPPGKEDLWELQFCRWWGWNWVRKRQVENKKHTKKGFKGICKRLCCKKDRKGHSKLQNLYNTPSNSATVREAYAYGVSETINNSIRGLELQRNISRRVSGPDEEKLKNIESWIKGKNVSYSSDECICCNPERHRLSTEESIEYITINCPCCHCKDQPTPEKINGETQTSKCTVNINVTQTTQSNDNNCATQTIKKHKKRRICVICCHCSQNHCCNCKSQVGEKQEKLKFQASAEQAFKPTNYKKTKDITTVEQHSVLRNLPYLFYPLDMLYGNFSKFGKLPENCLKLHTKSDILDEVHKTKIDDHFSSPISGKIYNLTPIKVDNCDVKTILPDPFDVSADVKHLEKLECEIQTDLESRVMLDAVCDAILTNKRDTTSSTILNEFSCSFKEPEPDDINGINIEDKYEPPELTKIVFDEMNYSNIFKKDDAPKLNCCDISILNTRSNVTKPDLNLGTGGASNFFSNGNQKEVNDRDGVIKSLMLKYDSACRQAPLKKMYEDHNTHERFNNSSSGSTINKKEFQQVKLEGFNNTYSSHMSNTNIDDIFRKIDEIVIKSKINDKEIQNVLNTIPQRTSYYFPSEGNASSSNCDIDMKKSFTQSTAFMEEVNLFSEILEKKESDQTASKINESGEKKTPVEETFEDENEKVLPTRKRKKKSSLPLPKKIEKSNTTKKK